MKAKTFIVEYDHYILFTYVALILIGLYMQLNISSVRSSMSFFYKQTIWFGVSLFFVWLAFKKIDLEKLRKIIPILLILTLLLLILVLFIGERVKGGIRFFTITIPFVHLTFNVQPSLLARIVLILYFAHILDKKEKLIENSSPKQFLKKFNQLVVIPLLFFALILMERHFSPIVISGMTLLSLLFLAKIRFSTIFAIIGILLIFGFAIITFGPKYRNLRMQIYAKYSLFHKVFHKIGNYHVNA
ncbi:MAG: cell division protein FtsW, partial [Candidatus Cloacimonadota bacterium]